MLGGYRPTELPVDKGKVNRLCGPDGTTPHGPGYPPAGKSMRQLIVHIGAPKAGSTSLQTQLIANREALSAQAIECVLPWGAGIEELTRFGDALLGREALGQRRRAMQELRRIAAESRAETLILTYENLQQAARWRRLPRHFSAIARQTRFALKVAAFIRPPHLAINSIYTQSVRALRTAETFSAFAERTRRERRFDLPRFYRQWTGLTGAAFHPIPFTPAELSPDLFTRFFAEFSVDAERLEGMSGLVRAHNPSPGPMTVELMRRLAGRGAAQLAPSDRYRLRNAALTRAAKAGWNQDRFTGVTNEIRDALDRQTAGSNETFARRYWNRSWQDIFKTDYEPDFASNELALASSRDADGELESTIDELVAELGVSLKR